MVAVLAGRGVRLLVALTLVFALGAGTSEAATKKVKRPAGAVKLAKKDLKKAGRVSCGRIKGKWLSGTALKPVKARYFISHAQQAKNLAKAAKKKKGAARKKLLKQAAKMAAKAKKDLVLFYY